MAFSANVSFKKKTCHFVRKNDETMTKKLTKKKKRVGDVAGVAVFRKQCVSVCRVDITSR